MRLRETGPRTFPHLIGWVVSSLLLFLTLRPARAQFTYSEDFKNSTAAGWVLNPTGNSTPNVILTSGAAPRSGDPETGGTIDPSGSGWMRLTNNTLNLHNAVYFDTPIPSAGNTVNISFGVNLWGGNNFNSTGADGVTFFLYDASKPFQVGADGGSLGYAQKTGVNGLNGGFVAVALDAYGNFSVQGEGRVGGTTGLQANSVSVRGPGQGTAGYDYLAGTGYRDLTDTGQPKVLDTADGTVPALPYTMAFPNATIRPNQSTQYRNVSITINEASQLLVGMQFGEDGLWYNLLNVDLSSFVRPEQLKMGFSAGTGSGTIITEVGGLLQIQATAGSGNFIWDNRNGPSDSGVGNGVWGTGANDPLNWAGQTNPTLKSSVIFNSTYVSSAQTIDVTGSDKVITNLYLSGVNGYTLNTSEARKLIFDSVTAGGLTAINLTNDAAGNSAHTINLDLQMNKNLDINNNISPTFTVNGNIDTGGNVLGLKGAGTTVLAGAISGTGSLVKSDSGTTILRGTSANTYSGGTSITGGTLQIEKATALGAVSGAVSVGTGATLALGGSGTTFAANALTLNGDGVGGNGALRSIAGTNTWTGNVALGGTGSNSIGVDPTSALTVSGLISGGAGQNLTKVGAGTLTLSGANTYVGSTTVNAGTVSIGADTNLGAAPGAATPGHLALNGGTLQTTASFALAANRGISLGAAGGTISPTGATTLDYAGVIAGTAGGALTKAGSGTLALGGVSTYDGATAINAGTLRLGVNNALPATTGVTVNSGATFDLNSKSAQIGSLAGAGNTALGAGNTLTVSGAASTTYSGIMSGTGGLTKAGAGTLTMSGANTFTGNLQIDSGTVRLGSNNVFADSIGLILNGGTFSANGNSDRLASLSLLASSTIDYNSLAGQLTFGTGTRTVGGLTISNWAGSPTGGGASQLKVDSLTAFDTTFLNNITFAGYGTGADIIAVGGGFEVVPRTATSYTWGVDAGGNWSNATWLGGVNNPGGLGTTTVFGSAITADRTVTLDANLSAGYLVFNDNNNYTLAGTNTLTLDVTGGSAQINVSGGGSPTISTAIALSDALAINQNSAGGTLTLSGNISGTNQNLTVGGSDNTLISGNIATGSGTLTKNNGGTLTLSGTNTFTGATTVNGGTVAISADTNLGTAPGAATAGQLTLNGGTLQTTASFTLNANRGVALGAGSGTFNTDNGVTTTYGGVIAGSSGGALNKSGGGTLLLGGASTYNGATNINAGTLTLSAADRLPNGTAVTIASGATFNVNGFSETVGSIAGAGSLALGSPGTATTFTAGGDNSSTLFSGVIDGGANAALTKSGTGTLILSGANTFAGNTTVSSGIVNIQNGSALGTTAGRTTVNAGASLELQGGIAVGAEAVFLNGTGAGGNGALRNVGGNNSLAGAVTLQASSTITSTADTLTLTGGITGAGLALTVNGAGNTAISTTGVNTGTGGTLVKSGTGNLTLAAAGDYTGATTINTGTVEVQNATGLGTNAAGTTVVSGASLAFGGGTFTSAEGLSLAGSGVGGSGALRNTGADHTLSGAIALTAESTIGVATGTTLTSSGVISGTGFGLTKLDTGTLALSGANTYTGTTAVSAGTLLVSGTGTLGTAANPTTVSSGATLAFSNLSASTAENVTVAGSGVSGVGAIQSISGSNTATGNISMTGNTTIGVTAGSLLASGNVTGNYSLVKTGAGSLTVSGTANAYTGDTTVRNGTLLVTNNAPVGANGALGNATSAVQLGDAGTGSADNLALLIGNATGGRSVDRAISVNNFNPSGTATLGGTNTSGNNTFAGNIGLGRGTTLVAAAGGNVSFTGVLSGTGPVTAGNSTNTGTVVLNNANTYTGTTTVAYGTLVAANAGALGTTAGATTVNTGATLGLQGNIALPAGESLTLNGAGVSGVGALNNISGDNTVAGNLALASAATIGAQAGSLTLSGITEGGSSLTTTGAGNIILTGANTYTGATTIGGTGVVTLNKSGGNALGGTSGVTVNSGSTLAFGGSNQILNTADLSLAGGTILLNGFQQAMRNISLTASTTSTINYLNDGSLLRFTGSATVGAGGTLTIDNWAGNPTSGSTSYGLLFNTQAEALALENSVTFNGWAGLGSNNVIANGSYWEIVPIVTVREWQNANGGNWDSNNRWSGNAQPDGIGAIALLGNAITAGTTATISTSTGNTDIDTVGKLIIDSTSGRNYTVAGASSLEFDASGSTQLIVAGDGLHTISAPVRVLDDLTITNDGTATGNALTISGTMDVVNGTASDLIVAGTGNTRISGVISSSTTAGATLLKTGSGTLTLDGANTFSGGTTLRNGTLVINNATATGSAAAIVVNDASTSAAMNTSLLVGTDGVTLAKDITVNSQGATTTLGAAPSLTAATDDVTFSGTVALGKTVALTASGSSTATFSGVLSGTGGIDKVGSGRVILSGTGSNTFTGNVNVQGGTLELAKSGAGVDVIGATQGAIGDLAAVSLSGATSVLSINGPAAQTLEEIGSLSGVAGSNLNVAQATAFTLYTGANNASTTFAGTLTDTGGNLSLVKQGTGTMTLSGANAYDGATTVTAGTLVAANNTALGTATGSTTVNAGATLGLQGGITVTGEALSVAAATSPSAASVANLAGANTWTGTISMTGGTANDQVKFDATGGSQLTISGVISEATNAKVLTKTGTGTLVLSGANTYTGSTNVAAGTLVVANNNALGTTAAGTSVQIGATLATQGNVTVATGETFNLYGTVAPPSAPSIKNISDTNILQGAITLNGGINTGVAIDSNTGSLTLNGAITQASNPNYVIKTGAGDLTLGGGSGNTFSGGFTINDGTVIAAKTAGDATGAGNVNIGDGIGPAASATLRLNASNQTNNSSAVTIQTDGRLDLQSFNDTVGALTMSGGNVQGTGTLTLGNTLTFNGVGSSTAAISANLNLGTAGTRIVQVGNNGITGDYPSPGLGDRDLSISGAITSTGGLNKTDLGTLELAGTTANTIAGNFQVSDGTVLLNKTSGIDATGSGSITVGNGVGAANTASLKLLSGSQINDGSTVTVLSDGRFNVNGVTETIAAFAGAGTIDTGTNGLLIAGGTVANFTFSGDLEGTGTVRKVGTGTLTFDQSINFSTGTLELNGGTLALAGNNTTFTVGTLRITGNTVLDFGMSTATTLNATNVIINPGSTLTITNWVHMQDYFFAQTGFYQFGGPSATFDVRGVQPQTQVVFTGWSATNTAWQSWDRQITPAPEPATYGAMLMGSVLGLLGFRRWKKKSAARK